MFRLYKLLVCFGGMSEVGIFGKRNVRSNYCLHVSR